MKAKNWILTPRVPLWVYCCKIEGFKGKPLEKHHFDALFWKLITFFDVELEANIYRIWRYGMVLVLAHTMDPSGPFWGMKSICTHAGTRLKNLDENRSFLGPTMVSAPYGVSNIKIVKNLPIEVHSPQKSIYSTPIHLKLIIRPKLWMQKTGF